MDETQRRVDEIRKGSTEIENNLIDSLRAGRISRREFIRRGTVVGMSIPLLGFLAGHNRPSDGLGVGENPGLDGFVLSGRGHVVTFASV